MGDQVVFFGWDKSVPGREELSAEHFQEFVGYLNDLKQEGMIESFDPVLLAAHGGDMNGFFLIRGDDNQLHNVTESEAWNMHLVRASLHLEGAGAVFGMTGKMAMQQMELWSSLIPSN